jgi:hypothetical protein
MLKGGMTIPQAQSITGHKSERMTDWYCHFDPAEFGKAMKIQETLLKPDSNAANGQTEKILPFRAKETA